MRRHAIFLSILTFSGGLAVAACNRPDAAPSEGSPPPAAATTPAPPAPEPRAAASAVPGELAENLYDAATAGDWATASAKLDSLRAFVSTSPASSGSQAQLDALAQAVPTRNRVRALEASNALTRDFAQATASESPVPVEVVLLDYYGRELQIGASEGGAGVPRLQRAADSIRSTWEAVRPRVEQRGGTAESQRFSTLVQRVVAARTPASYGAVAIPILDEVDRLEAVFER